MKTAPSHTALYPRPEPSFQVVLARNPGEVEFHQAVHEVLGGLGPMVAKRPEFADHALLPVGHDRAPAPPR